MRFFRQLHSAFGSIVNNVASDCSCMTKQILLTSFDTWQAHQASNASDDLLVAMSQQKLFENVKAKIKLLRKLPVAFALAPQQVIAEMDALQPDFVICCGMAESRQDLTLESNGKHQEDVLWTAIDLDRLLEKLVTPKVSHDAGTFVCNHLYYAVLKHIQSQQSSCQCLFIHVPILSETNHPSILKDFLVILQRLSSF